MCANSLPPALPHGSNARTRTPADADVAWQPPGSSGSACSSGSVERAVWRPCASRQGTLIDLRRSLCTLWCFRVLAVPACVASQTHYGIRASGAVWNCARPPDPPQFVRAPALESSA